MIKRTYKNIFVFMAIAVATAAFMIFSMTSPALAQVDSFKQIFSSFNGPYDVAVDQSSGNIYVTDSGNNRIKKLDADGNFILQWGSAGSGDGQFNNPDRIAVDQSGNVYVVDFLNYRVQKFDANGTFITKWGSHGSGDGQMTSPSGLAVDASGNVYLAESYRIQKFDANGTFITKWGESGTGDGQFNNIAAIAVDQSGNVYAMERQNSRISKFDANGTFIMKFGSAGTGDGQFSDPVGIAVDQSGNIYGSDNGNRIQKFDANGTFIMKWAISPAMYHPFGIDVYNSGNAFYVADVGRNCIYRFPTQLHPPIAKITEGDQNTFRDRDISFSGKPGSYDPDGDAIVLYMWDFGDGKTATSEGAAVHRYYAMGEFTVSLIVVDSRGAQSAPYTCKVNVLDQAPAGVNAGPDQTGGVNDLLSFAGSGYDPEGDPITFSWDFGDGATASGQNVTHQYTAVGNYTVALTVADSYGEQSIGRCTVTITAPAPIAVIAGPIAKTTDINVPLTFDGSGSYDPTGRPIVRYFWWFSDNEISAEGATVSHSFANYGTYTVALSVMNDIGAWSETVACLVLVEMQQTETPPLYTLKFGEPGSGNSQFQSPTGKVDDPAGNMYVVDAGNCRIQKFDASGNYITQWGGPGPGNGTFAPPFDIAINPSGNVIVLDMGNSLVQIFDQNGIFISQFGGVGSGNGQFNGPYGIAVDKSGNIYVADTNNSRIQKFDAAGNYIAQVGTNGTGNGEFNTPYDVAADSNGNIYVADTGNARVQKFDPSLAYIKQWGQPGLSPGQFLAPLRIELDKSDNVYVSNIFFIDKFTSTGTFMTRWGVYPPTGDDGTFYTAAGLAISPSGTINVTDISLNRVQVFTPSVLPNQSPVADAGADITISALTAAFTATAAFDGGLSYDPDGTITSYSWDFGDGTASSNGSTVSHTFNALGTYTVTLTVTDDKGATATDTCVVSMNGKFIQCGTSGQIKIPMPSASGELPPGLDTAEKTIYLTAAEFALYHPVSQGKSPKTGKGFQVYTK